MVDPRSFAEGLGLPGLMDLHTHFLPPRVMAKVAGERPGVGHGAQSRWPLSLRCTASTFSRLAVRSASEWRLS